MTSRLPKQEILKRNQVPEDKMDLFMQLTPRQLRFFMEYIKNGGVGTDAYRKVYRKSNPQNAAWAAYHLLKKYPEVRKVLYEMWGFGEKDFIQVLNDAKKANRQQIYKSKVYEFPDHFARMKAVELAKKFKGDGEEGDTGPKVQVLIVNDPSKGIFRVEDQS